MLVALKTAVELDMSMWVAIHHSDWFYEWVIPLLGTSMPGITELIVVSVITVFAATVKACYQSALKRTYFRVLEIRGLIARGLVASKSDWVLAVAHLGGAEVETHAIRNLASPEGVWSWESPESEGQQTTFCIPAKDPNLEIAIYLTEPTVGEKRLGSTTIDVGNLAKNEWRAYRFEQCRLEATDTISRRGSAEIFTRSMRFSAGLGELAFELRSKRDGPITPLAFLVAGMRPITECLVLKWLTALCCAPCFLCCCLWRLRTRRQRRAPIAMSGGKTGGKYESGVKEGLLPGKSSGAKPAEKEPLAFRCKSWRWLLRVVVFVWIAVTLGRYLYWAVVSTHDRKTLWLPVRLLCEAKIFSWFVSEPMALATTYWTLKLFLPSAVPQLAVDTSRPAGYKGSRR